jgi:hypothetical protein
MTVPTSITVRVPLKIRHRPERKTMVTPAQEATEPVVRTGADPALLKALARAFRYQRLLDEGCYASISEMAAGERIERGYLGTRLRLTLLAPHIVDAILDGQQPEALSLPRLLALFSSIWAEQRPAFSTPTCPSKGTHNKPHHLHTR